MNFFAGGVRLLLLLVTGLVFLVLRSLHLHFLQVVLNFQMLLDHFWVYLLPVTVEAGLQRLCFLFRLVLSYWVSVTVGIVWTSELAVILISVLVCFGVHL